MSTIEFYLPVTIVIIPDVLVTNLITKLSKPCLVVMTFQTMLAGMKVSINGTQNSHVNLFSMMFNLQLCVVSRHIPFLQFVALWD